MNQDLGNLLNVQVANLNILYVKLHSYHWYVKGSNFYALHEKFEQLYNEVTEKMDAIAERLLTMKGRPAATMKEYLSLATIQEASGSEDANGMVNQLISDFTALADAYEQGITIAEQAGDHVTADLFTGFKGDFEKHVWMLRAYLGS